MSEKSEAPSLGDIMSAAGFALGLVTAWHYFAGWSYAYYYFDRFRIPLLMIDVPTEHVFVYGGLVIWKNWYWAVLASLVLLALAWFCYRHSSKLGRFGVSSILVVLVVLLFVLARWGGVMTAQNDFLVQSANDFAAYPRVRFALGKEVTALEQSVVADLGSTDCGRLLLYSKDRVFLIRPVKDHPLDLDTFVLPWDDITTLRITSTYESCR